MWLNLQPLGHKKSYPTGYSGFNNVQRANQENLETEQVAQGLTDDKTYHPGYHKDGQVLKSFSPPYMKNRTVNCTEY